VMQVTEGEQYFSRVDPVVNAFRTFSRLNDVAVTGRVAVVPTDSYAETLVESASEVNADFLLMPWSEFGSNAEDQPAASAVSSSERFAGRQQIELVQRVLQKALPVCNVGVFISAGFGGSLPRDIHAPLDRSIGRLSARGRTGLPTLPLTDKSHHIFFPFFGGADDQAAMQFVLQVAQNPNVTLSIVHFTLQASDDVDEISPTLPATAQVRSTFSRMTSKANKTEKRPEPEGNRTSKVIDDVTAQDLALLAAVRKSPPGELAGRITVTEINTTIGTAPTDALSQATQLIDKSPNNAGDIIVTGRRHPALGDQGLDGGYDLWRTIGVVGNEMAVSDVKASILVIQAARRRMDY
jgi:hypothetical protein